MVAVLELMRPLILKILDLSRHPIFGALSAINLSAPTDQVATQQRTSSISNETPIVPKAMLLVEPN